MSDELGVSPRRRGPRAVEAGRRPASVGRPVDHLGRGLVVRRLIAAAAAVAVLVFVVAGFAVPRMLNLKTKL